MTWPSTTRTSTPTPRLTLRSKTKQEDSPTWCGCGQCRCKLRDFGCLPRISRRGHHRSLKHVRTDCSPFRYNQRFLMTGPVIHNVTRPPARCNLAPPSKSLRHCTVIVHTCTFLSRRNLLVMGKRHCHDQFLVSTSSREPRHVSHQHVDQQLRPPRSASEHSGAGIGLLNGRRALCGLGNLIRVLSCHAYLWLHDFLIQGFSLGHRTLQAPVVQTTEKWSTERERSRRSAIRKRSKHAVSCPMSNCRSCVRCSRKSLRGLNARCIFATHATLRTFRLTLLKIFLAYDSSHHLPIRFLWPYISDICLMCCGFWIVFLYMFTHVGVFVLLVETPKR